MPERPKSETGEDNQKPGSKTGKDNQIPVPGGDDTPQSSDSDTGEDTPEMMSLLRRTPWFAAIGAAIGAIIGALLMCLLHCCTDH